MNATMNFHNASLVTKAHRHNFDDDDDEVKVSGSIEE